MSINVNVNVNNLYRLFIYFHSRLRHIHIIISYHLVCARVCVCAYTCVYILITNNNNKTKMFHTNHVLLSIILVITLLTFTPTLSLNLKGCGPEHNDVTKCDYLASEMDNFPTDAYTITMWVKAHAPHTKDKQGEGEALFAFNTDRTIANARYVYRSSEVAAWMYSSNALLFVNSNGNSFSLYGREVTF